jgi:polyhydroxyalkanoate synthesis regulator phasin
MEKRPNSENELRNAFLRVIEEGISSDFKFGGIPQKFVDKVLNNARRMEVSFMDNDEAVAAGHVFYNETKETVDRFRKISTAQMDLLMAAGSLEARIEELKQKTSPSLEPWITKELVSLTERLRIVNRQLEALENERNSLAG